MLVDFLTLFPELVLPTLRLSMMARAQAASIVSFRAVNPRDFTYDRHQKVDDTPYGGEPGMLIRPEPVALALESLRPAEDCAVILTDPAGHRFDQQAAHDLSSRSQIVFLCGHYEGFDHRVELELVTHVFSIGDYVMTNGEIAALAMADSIVRLLPGVLGAPASLAADSFADGLLSAPNYTRPEEWRGHKVPAELRSGNHSEIAKWRRREALKITTLRRPDLLPQDVT